MEPAFLMVRPDVGTRQQPLHAAPTDVAHGAPLDGGLSHLLDGAVGRPIRLLGHRLARHRNDFEADGPAELRRPSRARAIGQALQPLRQESPAPPLDGFDVEIKLPRHGLRTAGFRARQNDLGSEDVALRRRVCAQPNAQLGITIPAAAMRRFWTMLAHSHGQTWNGSELGRSMGLTDKTVRSYLDILTGTFMVRQLQPWHVNVAKRQVKAPKVYFRDSGLLHSLLDLDSRDAVLAHPRAGASWEGFAIEQVCQAVSPAETYFWSVHGGAEVDLFFVVNGRRVGVEAKFIESPTATRSMRTAMVDVGLHHLWIVHPGAHVYPIDDRITAWPIAKVPELPAAIRKITPRP